jgi:PH/SEC7 domain-containing protein
MDAAKRKDLSSSVPTSPECAQQDVLRRNSSQQQQQNGMCVRKNDASGFRTSRSEDHLQHSQREGTMGNAIPIDIDEDVNSSLNTLLDTRNDSEGSQVIFFIALRIMQFVFNQKRLVSSLEFFS